MEKDVRIYDIPFSLVESYFNKLSKEQQEDLINQHIEIIKERIEFTCEERELKLEYIEILPCKIIHSIYSDKELIVQPYIKFRITELH